ncbi:MAG: type I DNA topoisomerase [Acidobacteriota bacterium]
MAEPTKHLVIVESPAKANTISRFLGGDYQVEASYGHVRDLPQNAKEIPAGVRKQSWARLGVNVDEGFEPLYVVPADKKKHVKRLKDALRGADRLLLATDEDREGESISWHVLELLDPKGKVDVQRIVFHEVTPEAIRSALESPRKVNENLVRAQEARRVLDRLYGYSLSPLLWKRVAPGLSAGRVQSVAVRLLVERERERIAFRSSTYWDLKAHLEAEGGRFKGRLVRVAGQRLADGKSFDSATGKLRDTQRLLLDGPAADGLRQGALAARPWKVSKLDLKPGQQRPAPPFITSTLQQEGNRKLRFTARRTMSVAQQLYEGIDLGGERIGLITYMRTDSLSLAGRAIDQARTVIEKAYGAEYLPAKPNRYKTKSKGAQEAHEAIRPTDLSRRPKDLKPYLNDDQFRLYELIWKRTIACQMLPAKFERTKLEVEVEVEDKTLTFAASGRQIVFPGFLRAYVEGSDDPDAELGDQETLLPPLTVGQAVEPLAVDAEEHATKAPFRFTEASLVKQLEEAGIGRPSTYASIISTVQDRGYVFKKGNELIPTFTAFCVTQLLEQQFEDLVDTEFTAHMEGALDEVAAGRREWNNLVGGFFLGGEEKPGLQRRVEEGEVVYPAIELGRDPESDDPIVVKIGRYGAYLRRGEGGSGNMASLPEDLPPADLTVEAAVEMLRGRGEKGEPITRDPGTGRDVYLQNGRFGAYLEVDQTEEEKESKVKPRRVSVPKGMKIDDVTPEIAGRLILLPRELGAHPESGEMISTGLGRYGPFVKHEKDYRNLATWEEACDLTFEAALEILAKPKAKRGRASRTVLKELGEAEGAEGPMQVLDGRYGPYVTDGKTNASLPKGSDPQAVTVEQALQLLEARRNAPKRPRRRRR